MSRKFWDDDSIQTALLTLAKSLNRMPSANELRNAGHNDLACVISRRGGMRLWARCLGLELRGSETHRGQAVEAAITLFLLERGFRVARQSTKAPFDLLVNDRMRVDVKSAKFSDYGAVRGFMFGGLRKPQHTCDLYLLCGVDARNSILWRYYIPAKAVAAGTITITEHGKYQRYLEDIDQLHAE